MSTEQDLAVIVPLEPGPAVLSAGAKAEAFSCAPNTRKAYVAGWNDFNSWGFQNWCAGLPASPADVGSYLKHQVETEGKSLATARNRLAAIAAAHRLGKHPDPVKDPLVKAMLKRLSRDYGKPRKQAKGLGRSQGDGADPAGPQGQAPAKGDRGPGGGAGRGGPGTPASDAGRAAPPLGDRGAHLGERRASGGRLRPAPRGKVQDRPVGRGLSPYPG